MVINEKIAAISLDGGTLCLDFVNTVRNRKSDPLPDYLDQFEDVVAWGARVGLVSDEYASGLCGWAAAQPDLAIKSFHQALECRELLHRLFQSIGQQQMPTKRDLDDFNRYLTATLPLLRIKAEGKTLAESWAFPATGLAAVVAPVVRDAHHLLLANKAERIKECPSCGWLFLDTTKNGKRRWCSMKSCGSNVKALEWYHRHKKTDA